MHKSWALWRLVVGCWKKEQKKAGEPDARGLRWFAARHMPVQGRLVDVAYDADGSRYGGGAGLAVWVDGELVASAPTLRRLVVPLAVRESLYM